MAFEYRFEFLLDLKRRARDEAGFAVNQAGAAIAKIESDIQTIQNQIAVARQKQAADRVGSLSVESILSGNRYEVQLTSDIHQLRDTIKKLGVELDRRQQVLIAAEAEVKRFEKFRDKALDEYQQEQLRLEQAELDDRVSSMMIQQRIAQQHAQES